MKYCSGCGQGTTEGAAFCENCGRSLDTTLDVPANEQPTRAETPASGRSSVRRRVVFVSLVLLLLLGLALGAVAYTSTLPIPASGYGRALVGTWKRVGRVYVGSAGGDVPSTSVMEFGSDGSLHTKDSYTLPGGSQETVLQQSTGEYAVDGDSIQVGTSSWLIVGMTRNSCDIQFRRDNANTRLHWVRQ